MRHRWLGIVGVVLPTILVAQTGRGPDAQSERGPYARIAILRPNDGDTVDFEAGYIRHLEWHRQAKDTWVWYGWTIWAGERQRWFVYATFGHSAASLDSPVAPAEDERDNISNVTPHAQYLGNALYEYLPGLSRGPPSSSSRPWTSCPGRRSLSRRRSAQANQPCTVRHSGIEWWRVESLRAMSDCVRRPAYRRFSMEAASKRSQTGSST